MSDPTSYKALDELLTRNGKKIASRKIANNTYAIRHDGVIAIRFHETEIVRYTSNSMVSLNSGGWLTMATKERINRFTPTAIQVFSQSGRWYVTTRMRLDSVTAPDFESFVPFADGILFDPFASIRGWRTTNHLQPAEVAREDAHNRAIEKLLDKYLRGLDVDTHRLITAHQGRFRIATGELDEDGAKLYRQVVPHENCAMCVRTDVGTLVGDKFEDVQHLIEHLQEKVYPYWLLRVATEQVNPSGGRVQIYDLTRRDLRAYLRQQLYVGPVALAHGKRPRHTRAWRLEKAAS